MNFTAPQTAMKNIGAYRNDPYLHSAVGVDANTCVETGVKAAQGISVE